MAAPVSAAGVRQRRMPLAGAAIAGMGCALGLATVGLLLLDRASPPNAGLAGLSDAWAVALRLSVQTIGLLTLAVVSGLVVWRQPRNAFSWALATTVLILAYHLFASEYAVHGLVIDPGSLPLADAAAWSQTLAGSATGIGGILALLLFPDGRLKSPRWRVLAGAGVLVVGAYMVANLDDPYPIWVGLWQQQTVPVTVPPALWALGATVSWASVALFPAEVLVALAAALCVILRMRAARGEARQQLKWFAYAAAIYVFASVVSLADSVAQLDWLPGLSKPIDDFAFSDAARDIAHWAGTAQDFSGMVLLPVAIGLAMLRYRLYDIDIVINRTILYGGLAVFVTGAYAIVVGGVGSVLGQRTGLNPLLSIVTIALLAVLLLPVRSRLQNLANRAIYGNRARPYDVLSDFAESIGRAEPADVLLPRMAELLRLGTSASITEVWAKVGDQLQLAASSPPAQTQPSSVVKTGEIAARFASGASVEPVFHDGEALGALVVVKPRGEELSTVERQLFHDLASQAGLVLGRFRLVQELRESRSRIVASQDQERHRIERNLHDGAQQRFVNALLALGMAHEEGKGRTDLLAEASLEVQAGLNELRSLARGLEPPLLSDAGIVAAVSALADSAPVVTTVVADGPDRRYARGIETAAYFVVAEALTNAIKHSGAMAVEVSIKETAGRLCVEVRDDGVGGADVSRGSGIIGLQDRVAAVGGRMAVDSPPGGGTLIRAELPCG